MIRRSFETACLVIGLSLVGACIPAAPVEIMSAREELRAASGSEAATEAPGEIAQARAALQEADACIARMGDPEVARDLAYVAMRHVERARTEAQIAEQIRVQQETYRREQDAAQRARLGAQTPGGVGVAQSPAANEPVVMVR